jgi:hypothetical protein
MEFVETLAAKSDQLNNVDLIGGERIIKITRVEVQKAEQPATIYYEGDNGKPWKPCLTMRRVIAGVWGKEKENYIGRHIELFRNPEIAFGKEKTGGTRISKMSHIEKDITVVVPVSRGKFAPYTVKPLILSAAPKEEAAKKKAADIIAEIQAGGNVDAILQREAAVIERFRNAYSGLYNEIINATTEINFSDEEIPA